jgi:superfamily II DNA or RNA helicase
MCIGGIFMNKQLRPYQVQALEDISLYFNKYNKVVLASSPSSGKTLMALTFASIHPGKILVLTHGQNVILDMWKNAMIDEGVSQETQDRITLGLPQSISRRAQVQYDYIIIDEAHEFYFAKMVQDIIKKQKKAKLLLLTGTPSKFVKANSEAIGKHKIPIVAIPGIELVMQGYMSDLYMSVVRSHADITDKDRNADNDLKESAAEKLVATVDEDMGELLEAMLKRLRSINPTKKRPLLSRMDKWSHAIGSLDKTMISCASIKQAEKVTAYLQSNNVNVVLSHSENDKDSDNVARFVSDPTVLVLVVVNRAILGFNLPSLVNVVDMTGSHNPDRIYQLFARVMRKHEGSHKYFFKVSSKLQVELTKLYVQAALMLLTKDFLTRYNGKNLKRMEILVKKETKNTNEPTPKSGRKNVATTYVMDKDLFEKVNMIQLFEYALGKANDSFGDYAFTTFGKAKDILNGFSIEDDIGVTKEEMYAWLLKQKEMVNETV